MWINAFAIEDKVLSPIELLVLATTPEETITPKDLSEKLIDSTEAWNPAAGTLYPVLSRLKDQGLLVRTRNRNLNFARTKKGSTFLSSILKPLFAQMKESQQYYLHIIQSLVNLQPVPLGMSDFFKRLERLSNQYSSKLKELEISAKRKDEEAFDVPINFE